MLEGVICLAAFLQGPSVGAYEQAKPLNIGIISSEKSIETSHIAYILGPGDELEIELVDLPELSGR